MALMMQGLTTAGTLMKMKTAGRLYYWYRKVAAVAATRLTRASWRRSFCPNRTPLIMRQHPSAIFIGSDIGVKGVNIRLVFLESCFLIHLEGLKTP